MDKNTNNHNHSILENPINIDLSELWELKIKQNDEADTKILNSKSSDFHLLWAEI